MKRMYQFQLAFEPDPKGGYTVTVPALPGCVTYGANMQEARTMARDAIALYVEDMVAEGEEIPEESGTLWSILDVEVPAR